MRSLVIAHFSAQAGQSQHKQIYFQQTKRIFKKIIKIREDQFSSK